jgi:pimeloyl-ACP methyl ester carboxylesterase
MKRAALLALSFLSCGHTGIAAAQNAAQVAAQVAAQDAAQIPYGNNPKAGHFFQVDDAKIYYEIYGSGDPLVLLHGGLYGYIDEFSEVIPELSRHYTVIAIALRGHGKSEMGTKPLSNALFAQDSAAVIRHVTNKPVNLVGFSVGAMSSYLLTINHPDLVQKLIAVGGPIGGSEPSASAAGPSAESVAEFNKQLSPNFIARRDKIYPDRAAWDRLVVAMMKAEANGAGVPEDKVKLIQCPTLIAAGDRDPVGAENFAQIYHLLPHAELAIVPGCGHVVFNCNPNLMIELVEHFLQQP